MNCEVSIHDAQTRATSPPRRFPFASTKFHACLASIDWKNSPTRKMKPAKAQLCQPRIFTVSALM